MIVATEPSGRAISLRRANILITSGARLLRFREQFTTLIEAGGFIARAAKRHLAKSIL